MATVYNEKDHAFERKWAQLIDPDCIQTICGHLLLSVAISERGVSSKVNEFRSKLHLNFFCFT